MNMIYKHATETLIWVGQAAEDSDRALKFLRVLDLDIENSGYTKGVKNKLTFLNTDLGAHLLNAIEAIVHRSWFSMVWTLQEALLSQHCTMVCGGVALQWSAIFTWWQAMNHFSLNAVLYRHSDSTHDAEIGYAYEAGFPDPEDRITPDPLLYPGTALLRVEGFTFDTVRCVTQASLSVEGPGEDGMMEGMERWLQECYPLVYEVLGMTHEAVVGLCQTLTAFPPRPGSPTKEWEWEELVEKASVAYKAWHDGCAGWNHEVDVPLCDSWERLNGRTFINTELGRIGLGTVDMRSGDLVCIIHGACSVYVLHKLDHETVLSRGVHAMEDLAGRSALFGLVERAYINGHMHGEAFTAPGRGLAREFVLT